jgi:hypothetical protein
MDWLTTIPLIVALIGNLGALALQTVAVRLLTIVPAVFFVGGISAAALMAICRWWLKRATGELDMLHSPARH